MPSVGWPFGLAGTRGLECFLARCALRPSGNIGRGPRGSLEGLLTGELSRDRVEGGGLAEHQPPCLQAGGAPKVEVALWGACRFLLL